VTGTAARLVAPAALGASLALALGACSGSGRGDEPAGAAGTATTATTPPAATGGPADTAATTAATAPAPAPAPTTTVAELSAAGETPEVVAQQVIAAERTIRDPSVTAETAAAAGRLQQLAYRRLSARHETWDPVVAAAVPPDVRPAFDANLRARDALRSLLASSDAPLSPTLPAWRIRAPKPPEVLRGFYAEAEALSGVPWPYLAAIHLVETRMGRIEGLSSAGAQGPMQFLPSTWEECCSGDVHDDHDAIVGAARYLVRNGAPADMDRALFRYNNHRGYVEAIKAHASVMAADERAYLGYHAWQVFYASAAGDVRLPVDYEATAPLDAAAYVAAHPEDVER